MNYEEKAKAYDKALEVAKRLLCFDKAGLEDSYTPNDLYEIFPELKESEDEIYKRAIRQMYSFLPNKPTYIGDVRVEDIFSWLEKQGEQREQLINKACDVLVNCIEDFMLRRMEIWDEECKKQTLENIRKKLEE